jgi:uncharacterized iron-regulated protein
VPIFRGDGSAAGWDDLVSAAEHADAVIIGENHGHPLGLAAAAVLWEDLLARTDHPALALEFFERDEQTRLDDYLAGVTDEALFRKRTARTNANYPPGHRAMIEAAKAKRRPVIAANAPRPYASFARLKGFEQLAALTPDQRRLFRVPDELPGPDSPYRKRFDEIMTENAGAGHGKDKASPAKDEKAQAEHKARLDATFRSQSMWDWTMAQSVASAVAGGHKPTVLVVGRFHCDSDGGLVLALRKLRPGVRAVVVSFVDEAAPVSAAGEAGRLRDEDRARGDFVVYVGPSK